ncbi:MAG: hypothetical protein ACYCRE_08940 [Acidobacteriaceae bacterium]
MIVPSKIDAHPVHFGDKSGKEQNSVILMFIPMLMGQQIPLWPDDHPRRHKSSSPVPQFPPKASTARATVPVKWKEFLLGHAKICAIRVRFYLQLIDSLEESIRPLNCYDMNAICKEAPP